MAPERLHVVSQIHLILKLLDFVCHQGGPKIGGPKII
jgi:hypothetical protein